MSSSFIAPALPHTVGRRQLNRQTGVCALSASAGGDASQTDRDRIVQALLDRQRMRKMLIAKDAAEKKQLWDAQVAELRTKPEHLENHERQVVSEAVLAPRQTPPEIKVPPATAVVKERAVPQRAGSREPRKSTADNAKEAVTTKALSETGKSVAPRAEAKIPIESKKATEVKQSIEERKPVQGTTLIEDSHRKADVWVERSKAQRAGTSAEDKAVVEEVRTANSAASIPPAAPPSAALETRPLTESTSLPKSVLFAPEIPKEKKKAPAGSTKQGMAVSGTSAKATKSKKEAKTSQRRKGASGDAEGPNLASIGEALIGAIVDGVPAPVGEESGDGASSSNLGNASEKHVVVKKPDQGLIDLVATGRLKNLTVTKLKRLLSENGQKTIGKKAELIARLTSFVKSH